MYTIKETDHERQHLLAAFLRPASLDALSKIQLKKNAKILDIGCGLGDTSLMLLQCFRGAEVTGIDADKALIESAINEKSWQHANLQFVHDDALHLPFEDNSFDFVFCRFVLVHIPNGFAAMKEMKRVCKPGGIVFAQEPDISLFIAYPENDAYSRCKEYANLLFADAVMGRKLVCYFKKLGINNIQHAVNISLNDHTSSNKKLFTLTSVAMGNALLKKNILDKEGLQEWISDFRKTEDDPEAVVLSFPAISVWGMKMF